MRVESTFFTLHFPIEILLYKYNTEFISRVYRLSEVIVLEIWLKVESVYVSLDLNKERFEEYLH